MKTSPLTVSLLIISVCLGSTTAVSAQGSLTPPGPPAPTMKSLAQIEPRMPISSSPFTITSGGSYYLTTNLTGLSGTNGITVTANNVTVDLNGFALVGVSGSLNGIATIGSVTNLIVRNGNISGWGGVGVNASGPFLALNSLCEHLTIANCGNGILFTAGVVSDCAILSCSSDGIDVQTVGTISGCTILSCNGNGVLLESGTISGCTIQSCGNIGITGFSVNVSHCMIASCHAGMNITQGTVSGCSVISSTLNGIAMNGGTVSGCTVNGNGASGIFTAGPGCLITGNNCIGNNTSGNGSAAGVTIFYSNNRIEENNVAANGVAGIAVNNISISSNNVIIKNTVSGNGANNYVTPGSQVVGPIISTAGTITSSSPWANFSF